MLIGILSVRNHRYHPNRRLIEAAEEQGHRVSLIHPRDCFFEVTAGRPQLGIRGVDARPDVLLPRIGATINDYALSLVRHFELSGIPVVNDFQSVLLARNKFLGLQSLARKGIPVPDSHLIGNFQLFKEAVRKIGGYPVVAKTLSSRQGTGVVLVESQATAEFIIHNLLDKSQGLLIQEYVPSHGRRDIRAFVLGNRVIGAMELRPKPTDFRSNIHLTGGGRPVTLGQGLAELAISSTRTLGLEISGTDIIVDGSGTAKVVEVNYSPGFRGLEASTGLDIASQIVQYVTENYGSASCI
ncbi:MAG: RimK family alpha-L-glutamate ligase [Desulfatiglandaceae bacterium]